MSIDRRQFFAAICATVATAAIKPAAGRIVELSSNLPEPDAERLARAENLHEYLLYPTAWDYGLAKLLVRSDEKIRDDQMYLRLAMTNGDLTVNAIILDVKHDEARDLIEKVRATEQVKLTWDTGHDFYVDSVKIDQMQSHVQRTVIDVTAFGDESRRYMYGIRGST